jgi:hypothetical protein
MCMGTDETVRSNFHRMLVSGTDDCVFHHYAVITQVHGFAFRRYACAKQNSASPLRALKPKLSGYC